MVATLKLLSNLFIGFFASFFSHQNLEVIHLDANHPSSSMIQQLQNFESSFVYPFSEAETFTIQHGKNGDYFAFFKGLGMPYYYVVMNKKNKKVNKVISGKVVTIEQKAGEIAAAVCMILRTIKTSTGKEVKAWYICDLKVDEKYQGEHIPTYLAYNIFSNYFKCARGYAICMNPVSGEPKAAQIFKEHGPLSGMVHTQTLNLYTMNMEEVKKHYDALQKGMIYYGSMDKNKKLGIHPTFGVKDYTIQNIHTQGTYEWSLNHLIPSDTDFTPHGDATYMLCAVDGTALDSYFHQVLGKPTSTAQIVSYGMKEVDFNFLTSDQI